MQNADLNDKSGRLKIIEVRKYFESIYKNR